MSLLPVGIGASGDDAYEITDSLRLRSSASAYLARTPASNGNRQIFTFSAWVKRGKLGAENVIFHAGTASTNRGHLRFNSDDTCEWAYFNGSWILWLKTTAVFRDPSAWYHIVGRCNTTNGTSNLYINGVDQTSLSQNAKPSGSQSTSFGQAVEHQLGQRGFGDAGYLDGYVTEVNFIDGQALAPTDFGEFDANGTWKAKDYTGTYGTNGFYLPMKPTTQATGFNTVLYSGNTQAMNVDGVGFSPDFVWIKNRLAGNPHYLYDSVRGAHNSLRSDATTAEDGYPYQLTSFDTDGFSLPTDTAGYNNYAGRNYVAWCWDAGSGSPVSNTVGTIPSTVKANDATGFSIVSYEGTGGATDTIGHGLSSAPEMVIVKDRDAGNFWSVYHVGVDATAPEDYLMRLNTTNSRLNGSVYWNDTAPTSSVFTVGTSSALNDTHDYIAYCFHSVAGYSKFGSYTGTGTTTGNVTTVGFRPAFLMVKGTSITSEWVILDNTRDPNPDPAKHVLIPNRTNADSTSAAGLYVKFTDTGFQPVGVGTDTNSSGQTYIYMAFADTRDAVFNFDASGNKNNWLPNNINSNAESETTYDLMKDTPSLVDENAGNFATLNPLKNYNNTLADGNLNISASSASTTTIVLATIGVSSGKWYWEYMQTSTTGAGGNLCLSGLARDNITMTATHSYVGLDSNGWGYYGNGWTYHNATANQTYGASYGNNDVIGVAFDADAGTLVFYKNGVSQGTAYTGLTSGPYFPAFGDGGSTTNIAQNVNFGQQPFKYTPPTGFKKLNTFNLPDSTIEKGSDYFNTVTYSGTGSARSITGVGFQPDFIWWKGRNQSSSHLLMNAVVGNSRYLYSNATSAEQTDGTNVLTSFDADGYTLPNDTAGYANKSGRTYVAWNWLASNTTASNTDGSITSTVSANTEAGFSIATATTVSSYGSFPFTIGHGLGTAPAMVIYKSRTSSGQNWWVWHKDLPNAATGRGILLNSSGAEVNGGYFASNPATTTTMGINAAALINDSVVMYSFAEIEGYSAFGSYTGNGSADGTFVYTGFRPAFVVIKETTSTGSWVMLDTTRSTYNVINNDSLWANLADAEGGSASYFDMLSNGFKIRDTDSDKNSSGQTYIYMAFAENPFKNALAR